MLIFSLGLCPLCNEVHAVSGQEMISPFAREVMCRLRGLLILADSGPAKPPRIPITAEDANEGNFPQGRKKIHAEQIK